MNLEGKQYTWQGPHQGKQGLENHAKSWAAEASWQLWKMMMGSDCPLGAPSAGDSEGGKGLLGSSQIHWASADWQRFRSALLHAMWHVHQNKKKTSECKNALAFTHALNIYQHSLTTLLSVHPAICLSSEHSFKPTASTARGGENAFRCSYSLAQKKRPTISPRPANTDSKTSWIHNLERKFLWFTKPVRLEL